MEHLCCALAAYLFLGHFTLAIELLNTACAAVRVEVVDLPVELQLGLRWVIECLAA